MENFNELVDLVAPSKNAKNKGNEKMWAQIRPQASLPDWLFPFFHTYGSGVFAGFDNKGGFLDFLAIMNVFEKPFLDRHRAMGEFFSGSNEISRLPFVFFPEAPDGLFPITQTDQAMFLLIDPKNERRVFVTDNHLCYFREIGHNYVDYLIMLFQGRISDLWSIPKKATVSTVTVVDSWGDAQRIPRADYYDD